MPYAIVNDTTGNATFSDTPPTPVLPGFYVVEVDAIPVEWQTRWDPQTRSIVTATVMDVRLDRIEALAMRIEEAVDRIEAKLG